MRLLRWAPRLTLLTALVIGAAACTTETVSNSNAPNNTVASPSPSPTANMPETAQANAAPVTLPILNALFADESFKTELKSKLDLTDGQIERLQKSASEEIARLHETNAEDQTGDAANARERATETVRGTIGDQKAAALFNLANEHWVKGSEEVDSGTKPGELSLLPGPNAVPRDSRIVVNIPAFRMDVFQDGSITKSYKIGIGYPEFPLPTGLRKAQQIIFNPTWTPPDEPWVASRKDITAGQKIEAGSKLNPLGPIKIPIGLPSLIHGGKSPAKIGTFASHGCVGLTTPQVKDFAKVLAHTAGSDISNQTMENYLRDNTKTKVVKLPKVIPVELRYETIVVEDGKLHIYKDVYDQNTNTEEKLRAVLQANGLTFEQLSEAERNEALDALNAMSAHPKKQTSDKSAQSNSNRTTKNAEKKSLTAKKPGRNDKEVVIELAGLSGKGYPAPVELDTGSGKPKAQTPLSRSKK
ncbi:MAG TPA: L,D-transpeptidase family protein [Pyrinomonadaceae bacterium]